MCRLRRKTLDWYNMKAWVSEEHYSYYNKLRRKHEKGIICVNCFLLVVRIDLLLLFGAHQDLSWTSLKFSCILPQRIPRFLLEIMQIYVENGLYLWWILAWPRRQPDITVVLQLSINEYSSNLQEYKNTFSNSFSAKHCCYFCCCCCCCYWCCS